MSKPVKWGDLELPIRPDTIIPEPAEPRRPLRACDLPAIMNEDDWFDAYRYALIQFVADWNHSNDPQALIADPPMYEGDDWRVLPTIASVVHALADRKTLTVPELVWGHKAPEEWVVFCDPPGSYFWRLEKPKAPSTCLHHQVYFNPRLLDKGTPDWWLPWN